jgi:large subunit ribosomal protein L30
MPKGKPKAKELRVTLVRSPIGYRKDQRHTLQCLGLRKIRQTAVHRDEPAIRGMIHKIIHLVEVEEC